MWQIASHVCRLKIHMRSVYTYSWVNSPMTSPAASHSVQSQNSLKEAAAKAELHFVPCHSLTQLISCVRCVTNNMLLWLGTTEGIVLQSPSLSEKVASDELGDAMWLVLFCGWLSECSTSNKSTNTRTYGQSLELVPLFTCFGSLIGVDFKIKTVELRGKKIRLQIW